MLSDDIISTALWLTDVAGGHRDGDTRMYIYTDTCIHAHTDTHVYLCLSVLVCVCVCKATHTYTGYHGNNVVIP